MINLKPPTDKWETVINVKGPQLKQMPIQLYAQVRVNAIRNKPTESPYNKAEVLTTEFLQAFHMLYTKINWLWCGVKMDSRNWNRDSNKSRCQNQNEFNHGKGHKSGCSDDDRRSHDPYDLNKCYQVNNELKNST